MIKNKLLWLVLVSIIIKISAIAWLGPRSMPDTQGYFETGRQLVSGDYSDYTGKRTPVYPLLIAAAGYNQYVVAGLQSAMGVGIAILLYLIFARLSGHDSYGLILGLTYTLNPSQILIESTLVSETTCTFILLFSVFYLFKILAKAAPPGAKDIAWLGFLCGLCILTRPQYQPLPLLIIFFLAYCFHSLSLSKIWKYIFLLVPIMLMLIPWAFFQYKRIGQFVLSPDLGYDMTNHTVKFIEAAPERYADLKEILIENRTVKLRTRHDTYNCVATSIPEMLKLRGYKYSDLCKELGEMNFAVIRLEPLLYLNSVLRSFVTFFKPTWYGRLFGIRSAVTSGGFILKTIALVYASFHLCCMLVFLTVPVFKLLKTRWTAFFTWTSELSFIYLLVLTTGISQAFVECGENARYKTSVEPLVICVACWILIKFATVFFSRNKKPAFIGQ